MLCLIMFNRFMFFAKYLDLLDVALSPLLSLTKEQVTESFY